MTGNGNRCRGEMLLRDLWDHYSRLESNGAYGKTGTQVIMVTYSIVDLVLLLWNNKPQKLFYI